MCYLWNKIRWFILNILERIFLYDVNIDMFVVEIFRKNVYIKISFVDCDKV